MTATGGVTAGQDPFLASVSVARDAVVEAATLAGWQTSDAAVLDGIRDLARLRGAVEAVHLALVRELDGRGLARSAPVATTPEGYLRTVCLMGAGQARRDVAAARATAPGQPLEPMAEELADGRRTRAHVDVGVRCLDRLPRSLLARPGAAETVVGYLRTAADGASPVQMDTAARQLLARLDPGGSEARERFDPASYERRFLDVHTDSTGMVVGSFQLDPVAGATLRTALDTCSAPAAGADGEPDRRQARERRADALVAVADLALGVAVPRRGERPRVVVHVEPDQLEAAALRPPAPSGSSPGPGWAWLEGGTPVPPRLLRRLACDAVLQRVLESSSLGPLDVGREHRLVTPAQRRALEARDGGCVVPGCAAPATWCDAHHVVHWVDGGPSDLDNYVLLCGGHHTAVHAGTWEVAVRDGQVWVTPPRRVDPARTPRRPQQHAVRGALRALRRPPASGPPTSRGTARGRSDAREPSAAGRRTTCGLGTQEETPDLDEDNLFAGLPLPAARPPAPDLPDDVFRPANRPDAPRDAGPPPAGPPAAGPPAAGRHAVHATTADLTIADLTTADPLTADPPAGCERELLRALFRSLPSHPVRAGP